MPTIIEIRGFPAKSAIIDCYDAIDSQIKEIIGTDSIIHFYPQEIRGGNFTEYDVVVVISNLLPAHDGGQKERLEEIRKVVFSNFSRRPDLPSVGKVLLYKQNMVRMLF